MGLFDKITRGITRGIGNAVSNATQQAVEKKATEILTPKINQAADTIAGSSKPSGATNTGSLEGAIGHLTNAVNGYATQAAQNMKVCLKCNKPTSVDKKFCPECGATLPEKTLAQAAVCPSCGKQNNLSEKFCSECGTKLPITIEAEENQRNLDEQVMNEWQEKLSNYPRWRLGGTDYNLEYYNEGYYIFTAKYPSHEEAYSAVISYRGFLKQNGFKEAGQYPSVEHLYKKENGVCYHVDTEHCFEGDADRPTIGFDKREPQGGFDYEKPVPKKKGFFGLFK